MLLSGGSFRITSILYSQTEYNRVSECGVDELLRGETYVPEKSVHIHGKGGRGGGRWWLVGLRYRGIAHPVRSEKRGKNLTSCRCSCFCSGIEKLANKERERGGEISFIFVSFKEIKKKKRKIFKKFTALNIN